ncbi:MAG: ABC transporter ATP-binding protein [Bacteroidetes bacterium]|nr:ABC transporter ATP-binding protein [Bacteroidota bacterium]
MFDIDNINEIWQTIARNKTRSLLTAFGVFWGIFILVILLACGNGFDNGLRSQIEGFATNSTFLITTPTTEAYKGYQKGRNWDVDMSDIEAIEKKIKGVDKVSPIFSQWTYNGENNVFYGTKGGNFSLKGVIPNYNEIDRCKVLYGRFINETDIVEARKVCVLGKKAYEDIIGTDKNPLGLMIKANGIYYHVVGVIEAYNNKVSISGSINETIILPLTTMQIAYNTGDKFDFFMFTTARGYNTKDLQTEVKNLLRERHDISPTDEGAFVCFDFEEMFTMFEYLFLGIKILIWIVGIGTLLSGVVGVSNIMLVTIKERTREIGVRRALGAKPSIIIRQVMAESLLLTILAGIVGLVLGVAIMAVVSGFVGNTPSDDVMFLDPQIGFGAAIAASIIVMLSGLLAGVLPAIRAIQIKAIDAIREE